ncbi:hypothetical protein SSCG_01476 [Streptomyces clavuligerus]|nr:hypothetical protein SSCG_01476 [Streptomyces clavuligerus]
MEPVAVPGGDAEQLAHHQDRQRLGEQVVQVGGRGPQLQGVQQAVDECADPSAQRPDPAGGERRDGVAEELSYRVMAGVVRARSPAMVRAPRTVPSARGPVDSGGRSEEVGPPEREGPRRALVPQGCPPLHGRSPPGARRSRAVVGPRPTGAAPLREPPLRGRLRTRPVGCSCVPQTTGIPRFPSGRGPVTRPAAALGAGVVAKNAAGAAGVSHDAADGLLRGGRRGAEGKIR